MQIIRDGDRVDISELVRHAKTQLLSDRIYVIDSNDHCKHIAAYIAWNEVGGNIFVKSPLLSQVQQFELDRKLAQVNVSNSVILHTSGTSGIPRLVVHTKKQFEQALTMGTKAMSWDENTRFLNFIPACTSGFWHIMIPPLVETNITMVLGDRKTMHSDLQKDVNSIILIPNVLDYFISSKNILDLKRFNTVGCGASKVTSKHAQFLFDSGAKRFVHLYGMTETCSPLLMRENFGMDGYSEYLELKPISDNNFKLVDNELYISGESLCENYTDFDHDGIWFKTGDLWEKEGDLIRFVGRKNEVVKINGHKISLVSIENVAEEHTDLGETLACVENTLGIDFVNLYHTNKIPIDKNKLKSIFGKYLSKHVIPRKYTHIDEIPRTSLGKKHRRSL